MIHTQASKKRKKEPYEIVLKDRFLKNEKPDNPYITAILYFVVFFLSFLLIFVCFFQLCLINGDSMMNTLHNKDHVLLLRATSSYKRGDIVVITRDKEDTGDKSNIVKRVIAVAGDTIRFDVVHVNETEETVVAYLKKKGEDEFVALEGDSDYAREPMLRNSGYFESDYFDKNDKDREIYIDDNCIYVMGDNRNHSKDSRLDGPYSVKNVYGKQVLLLKQGSLLEKFFIFLYNPNDAVD